VLLEISVLQTTLENAGFLSDADDGFRIMLEQQVEENQHLTLNFDTLARVGINAINKRQCRLPSPQNIK
jgi:hypothetical protein